jgi:hypothetical protein
MKLSPFAVWEGEVIRIFEEKMEVTTSDAQAILAVYQAQIDQAYADGLDAASAAALVQEASDAVAAQYRESGA